MPTLTQTVSLAVRPTTWSDTVDLAQIDPALIIDTITPSLTGTVNSVVAAINLDLASSAFTSTATAQVTLEKPDGSVWVSVSPSASTGATLPAPTGAAGPVMTPLNASSTATQSIQYGPAQASTSDAAALIGTGHVQLPVTASARVHATGPGNLLARFYTLAGADVGVQAQVEHLPGASGLYGAGNITISIGPLSDIVVVGGTASMPGPVTTTAQLVMVPLATTGASSTVSVNGFDPALGWLDQVNIGLSTSAAGSVALENLDSAAGGATVSQTASVALAGPDGNALVSASSSFNNSRQLGAFDGTADFSGASAASFTETAQANPTNPAASTTTRGAAFVNAGPVTLTAARTGSTTLDGPGNLDVATTLQAGADVSVSYTYWNTDLRYIDITANTNGTTDAQNYAGPVAGIQREFVWSGADASSIIAAAPNMFLKGGSGNDRLQVSGGSNVLDGGSGSNVLIGGTGSDGGADTFFVDARDSSAITWSTIVNFHRGDQATIFGFHPGVSTRPETAWDGQADNIGLTIHAETDGRGTGVDASLTFASIDQVTAAQHFAYTTGTLPGGIDYLLIQYM